MDLRLDWYERLAIALATLGAVVLVSATVAAAVVAWRAWRDVRPAGHALTLTGTSAKRAW